MKQLICLFSSFFLLTVSAQDSMLSINGVVTHDGYPVQNVGIKLKGTIQGVNTDEKGIFVIPGNPGDVLEFRHLGMKTVKVVLEDITTILNVKLVRKEVQLDEVVVKKTKRRTAVERELEYDNNKDLIRTQYGILDTRRSGLSIRMINGDNLNKAAPTFLEAIRGQLNGQVSYLGSIFDEEGTTVYLRLSSSLLGGNPPVIYDLDGVILYDPPLLLAMQEIDRIAVIRGIGASGRYGRRGHGGVIVINTKRGKYTNPKLTQKFKDSIKISRKRATEAFATRDWSTVVSGRLKALYDSDSEEKAIQVFETKKEKIIASPYDAIEAADYFVKEWKNEEKAKEIWKSVKKKHSNNAVVLKALAYTFEKNEDLLAAMQLYQAILSLRPNYSQSYRDLANINAELGRHKRALNLYARNLLNRVEAKQSGIDSIINIESHNLLVLNKMELTSEVVDIEKTLGYNPIRVLLEWNNGEAEFELQCMNPPNYYTWNHSFESNPERIEDEKNRGYSSKQFYLNQELGGKWRFNLKYLGNKAFEPTYLKTTIYFDFGKPTQRKEIKVFRLLKEEVNMHLLTIDLDAKTISG